MTIPAVPPEVIDELGRLVARWRTLTLDQAALRLPAVRECMTRIAALTVPDPVPDLGPQAAMDQLTVVAYDAACGGHQQRVHTELVALRRTLACPDHDGRTSGP